MGPFGRVLIDFVPQGAGTHRTQLIVWTPECLANGRFFFFACEVLHEIYGVIVLALLGGVPTTRSPDNFRQDQKIDRIKLYSGIWINSNLINQHHMFFSVC